MIFWGVVDEETEKAVELFIDRQRADSFVADVESDEPETAASLRVEPIEL